MVQGVGFRPFVYGLAERFGLNGRVGNDTGGVVIDVEGPREAVAGFLKSLEVDAPVLADIERVTVVTRPPRGSIGFRIVDSDHGGPRRTPVPADSATCKKCLAELFDPCDRRYRYPFLNCTDCGPRFTIVRDVPYDRGTTTMAEFPDVSGVCPGVPRPHRPSLPRPTRVLSRLRAPTAHRGRPRQTVG